MPGGALIALSTIASLRAAEIFEQKETILEMMNEGSVISVDNAVKILALVSASRNDFSEALFPELLEHLKFCRPKEVGQHAESIFVSVDSGNRDDYIRVLKGREDVLTDAQLTRIRKLYRKLNSAGADGT